MTIMKTKSPYKAGTYDVYVEQDRNGDEGDLIITVWSIPKGWADPQDIATAPLLARIEVSWEEYSQTPPAGLMGSQHVGRKAALQPEDLEELYGARLATRILLALYQAAERDFWGRDMYDNVVRKERKSAFPFMERAHDTLAILMAKVHP
jgi:hypothetical protein